MGGNVQSCISGRWHCSLLHIVLRRRVLFIDKRIDDTIFYGFSVGWIAHLT
jgi:hypothetical protein